MKVNLTREELIDLILHGDNASLRIYLDLFDSETKKEWERLRDLSKSELKRLERGEAVKKNYGLFEDLAVARSENSDNEDYSEE